MTEDLVEFASRDYFLLAGMLCFARGMDILSTWIATPNLYLEANPIARKLGWKWGALLNVAICVGLAISPLSAIVVATTSVLVAARNFQYAWAMRSLGELQYSQMVKMQLLQTSWRLYVGCLLVQSLLVALVGAAVIYFSGNYLVPIAIGMGIVGYAIAVTFYTLLSVWPLRRSMG